MSWVLGEGNKGPRVRRIQQSLRELGYHLSVDGVYGPETARMVELFQKRHGIKVTGRVGLSTYVKLVRAARKRHPRALTTTQGIDVSNHNGVVNWPLVARTKSFVILKATEGATFRDPTYPHNAEHARAAGELVGAFHFATASAGPVTQADEFLAYANPQPDDLIPSVDWERGLDGHVPAWYVIEQIARRIHHELGVWPIIYASPSTIDNAGIPLGSPLRFCPLWLAQWSITRVSPVHPFERVVIHQYTDKGKVPGINGNVDLDESLVNLMEFRVP